MEVLAPDGLPAVAGVLGVEHPLAQPPGLLVLDGEPTPVNSQRPVDGQSLRGPVAPISRRETHSVVAGGVEVGAHPCLPGPAGRIEFEGVVGVGIAGAGGRCCAAALSAGGDGDHVRGFLGAVQAEMDGGLVGPGEDEAAADALHLDQSQRVGVDGEGILLGVTALVASHRAGVASLLQTRLIAQEVGVVGVGVIAGEGAAWPSGSGADIVGVDGQSTLGGAGSRSAAEEVTVVLGCVDISPDRRPRASARGRSPGTASEASVSSS